MKPVLVGLLVLATAGSYACKASPTGPSSLTVDPPGPFSMQVGQSVTIKATAIVNGEPSYATFASSNAGVAPVDAATGLVQCISPGNAAITVTGGGTTRTVNVGCVSAVLIAVAPETISFTNTVGVTPCPQIIGTLRVANQSAGAVTLALSVSGAAITLDASSAILQPSNTLDFNASFNCSLQTSFSATIIVTATSGPATDVKTVAVQGTVTR